MILTKQIGVFFVRIQSLFFMMLLSIQSVYGNYSPLVTSIQYPILNLDPFIHKLSGYATYEGDKQGDFKGDIVALLDDGSSWKVHPKHEAQFLSWTPGQNIHVGRRESHYFYKREHKFTLVNHDLGEEVFVMLVRTPHVVIHSGQSVPTVKAVTANANGKETVRYLNYKKNITLSNGDLWEIESEAMDPEFAFGAEAYVGYNRSHDAEDRVLYFIIGGKEREAIFRTTRTGNFFYHW
jgi:hypothetical protein